MNKPEIEDGIHSGPNVIKVVGEIEQSQNMQATPVDI
jgi:hypothetical protein